MKLAMSNIAWTADEDRSVASVLRDAGVEAIEVAPGRLFERPLEASPSEILAVRRLWEAASLPIVSAQALLYGKPDLQMFGTPESREGLITYLSKIIRLCGALGCGPLVFGAPGNRRRGDLGFDDAVAEAIPVFQRLADAAGEAGCILCLEPNSVGYGCDFVTGLDEAAQFVRAVDHPAFGLVADTGNMQMEGETIGTLEAVVPLLRHLHLSMPRLAAIDENCAFIRDAIVAVAARGYQLRATIEMAAAPDPADRMRRLTGATVAIRGWMAQA